MSDLEPLLTTRDVAEYLGVPVATIYAWRYHGEGPPGFRVGRHLRFRSIDVEQWISDRLRAVSVGPSSAVFEREHDASALMRPDA